MTWGYFQINFEAKIIAAMPAVMAEKEARPSKQHVAREKFVGSSSAIDQGRTEHKWGLKSRGIAFIKIPL
jgi:hypothetical protein